MRIQNLSYIACLANWHVTLLVCVTACAAGEAEPAPHHVDLPPAFAGTPLSFQIQAEAQYLAARGDLVESVAVGARSTPKRSRRKSRTRLTTSMPSFNGAK